MVSMDRRKGTGQERKKPEMAAMGVKIVCALFCLSLIMSTPYAEQSSGGWVGVRDASAAPGDVQDGEPAGSENDDTPSQDDIEDFASEFDKDGDGEIDDPAEDEEEPADEPEEEDAGEEDDQDDQDDDDDDEHDDDDDGQGDRDDEDDSGDSLNSREDIDRDASPDYRISGFNRYAPEKKLRRLGDTSELTPLIQREEELLFEN